MLKNLLQFFLIHHAHRRANDAFLVDEIYTVQNNSIRFFAGKGFLSIDSVLTRYIVFFLSIPKFKSNH